MIDNLLNTLHSEIRKITRYDETFVEGAGGVVVQDTGQYVKLTDVRDILKQLKISAEQVKNSIGETAQMPGATGITVAVFNASEVPAGTKLYK